MLRLILKVRLKYCVVAQCWAFAIEMRLLMKSNELLIEFPWKLRRMLDSNNPEDNTPRQEVIMSRKASVLQFSRYLVLLSLLLFYCKSQGFQRSRQIRALLNSPKILLNPSKFSDFNAENAPTCVGFERAKKNVSP